MTADDQDRKPADPAKEGSVPPQEPAEGGDDVSPPTEGSPKG